MDGYEDELFEEEEDESHSQGSAEAHEGDWKSISFDEVQLGERIGGGSVGLVHRGTYMGKAVALKTLVSEIVLHSTLNTPTKNTHRSVIFPSAASLHRSTTAVLLINYYYHNRTL